MTDIRFDGRVAIVTGAGGGLGRCHALELARRGAKVVVNDLGGSVDGTGGNSAAAEAVVEEIKAMGGEAIANGSSVSDDAGVEKMIADTMEAFGRIDIVIANARQENMVFYNEHNGAGWSGYKLSDVKFNTYDIIAADLNNDGRPEIIEANSDELNFYYANRKNN